jgi:hypothetical protein
MTQSIDPNYERLILPAIERKQQRNLLGAFWIFSLGLLIYELFLPETQSLISNLAAILITIPALIPSYIWCSGRTVGMPIFPFFALTFISTYAFPLITNHPATKFYSLNNQLFASITVAIFLVIGAFVWFQVVKSNPKLPTFYRTLNSKKSHGTFLFVLLICLLFGLANNAGWLLITDGVFSATRSVILGLNALAAFILGYQLGSKKLSNWQSQLFIVLMIAYMITNAVTLTLVGAASTFIAATIAFIIGGKKIPVVSIVIFLVCFTLLHYGKGEMRTKYWVEGTTVSPWEYPAFYSEWLGHSFDYVNNRDNLSQSKQKSSLVERSSVIQMLLMAQDKSPQDVPYLYGKTYSILPQLIIPRFLDKNKIRSHEGTIRLNIHYGLQTRKQSESVTIGWDLLSESYANFGLFGCIGLAIFLGIFCGQCTRWSTNAPILSAQSLFSVLIMTFTFQTEWTAGVAVASLFQSLIVLFAIVVFFMKNFKVVSLPVVSQKVGVK